LQAGQFIGENDPLRVGHGRGQDDLFAGPYLRSLWRVFENGRKGLLPVIGSRLYALLDRPRRLRSCLAPDRALQLPDADLLPSSTGELDVIADYVGPALVKGWSIDEPDGR
jgi:hypothetical protein